MPVGERLALTLADADAAARVASAATHSARQKGSVYKDLLLLDACLELHLQQETRTAFSG